MCVSVCSFLPPRASRHRTFLYIIIVIFAENASFRSYGGIICLPRMPLTTPEPQNSDTNGIHATLLFTILTKNTSFRSYSTFVYLLRAHIININMCTYITLSGCVRADTYNLILIFASYYYASWPSTLYDSC